MIKNLDQLPKIIKEIKRIEESALSTLDPEKYNFFIGKNLAQLFEDEIGS